MNIETLDTASYIIIKRANMHNLKNLSVAIPRNKLVVITGLSGSGKSSLAFDTLYAEGQRRYVESLSSYARQFLGKLSKPKVDMIKGISPAIAIEQKVNTTNPRSTVGTTTEIYDYIKILFARIGKTYSPVSGKEVKKHTTTDVIDYILKQKSGEKLLLLAPVKILEGRSVYDNLQVMARQGFARIISEGEVFRIDSLDKNFDHPFMLVVQRMVVSDDEDFISRLSDAIETAFHEGKGECIVESSCGNRQQFSNRFELDGMNFVESQVHLFSFNNPYGACPNCEGYGKTIDIDQNRVIPNTELSIYDNAIAPWRSENMIAFKEQLIDHAYKFGFPIHKPWESLTAKQQQLIWSGNKYFTGLDDFFLELEAKNYKIQNRVILSRYRGRTICKVCKGKRLRPESDYVQLGGVSISNLVDLPLHQLAIFFEKLKIDNQQLQIAKRLLREINTRIDFLINVGLEYLTLNRNSNSLSGGESQRINLATSLGSSLVGSMYILDEPSIGLHSKDSIRLIKILKSLRDLGNTVIVVEHDEDIIKAADFIIDIGPEAGSYGGEVVAQGTFSEIEKQSSLTIDYLKGIRQITPPSSRRPVRRKITIVGAKENNLKKIDVDFPLDMLTVITGVSGSGKSTLVQKTLYLALQKRLEGIADNIGKFTELKGDIKHIKSVEYVNQNPIGRSSRSNPVTYIKAYDDIRQLFANQKHAKINNFVAKHFSFNVAGGRCEVCKGEGEITIEMQFMADVHLPCEVCNGQRFRQEILEITFQEKNINNILTMTIDDAIDFFRKNEQLSIADKLQPLQNVGMGYVALGQSSSTLSGGEAQRIKLASFLTKSHSKERKLFIFDEPTTGLHFHDVNKLIIAFDALIQKGHSVIVVEHNLDLIRCADYVIDLGLEGGDKGGNLVAIGTPEEVVANTKSITGQFLKQKL